MELTHCIADKIEQRAIVRENFAKAQLRGVFPAVVPGLLEDQRHGNSKQRDDYEEHKYTAVAEGSEEGASEDASRCHSNTGPTSSSRQCPSSVSGIVDGHEREDCIQDNTSRESFDYSSHHTSYHEEKSEAVRNEVTESVKEESDAQHQKTQLSGLASSQSRVKPASRKDRTQNVAQTVRPHSNPD